MKIYKKRNATPKEMVDVFHMTGRGMCIAISRRIHGEIPEIGETIMFDDELYEVTGIEFTSNLMSPPQPGDNVGLLVRKVK